ncbi:MAG: hypothetical protein LRY38_01410 [Aeromonadaceae bacterium]|nr:hypothetical protein [Aeromonadaceae bacterium]
MRLLMLCLCLLLAGCVTEIDGKPVPPPLEPKGEFAQLPFAATQQMMERLLAGEDKAKQEVLAAPNQQTPPVLFALALLLLQQGDQQGALFWYYTAQLRARSDANKSLDPTVSAGVTQLGNQFGAPIEQYAAEHPDMVRYIVPKVLRWDAKVTRQYDARWVALQGQDVRTKTVIAFQPQAKWPEIDRITREGFALGFRRAMQKQARLP